MQNEPSEPAKGIPFPQIEADISAKLLKKQLSPKRFKQSLKLQWASNGVNGRGKNYTIEKATKRSHEVALNIFCRLPCFREPYQKCGACGNVCAN